MGVTNQRETTLVWDKETGEPLYNAVGESVTRLDVKVWPLIPYDDLVVPAKTEPLPRVFKRANRITSGGSNSF